MCQVLYLCNQFCLSAHKGKTIFLCLPLITLLHISKQYQLVKFGQRSPCLVMSHLPEKVLTCHYFQWPKSSSECLTGDAEFCTVAIPNHRITHLSVFSSLILCAFEIYLLFKFHSLAH